MEPGPINKGMHANIQKKGKIFEKFGHKCTKFENICKRAGKCMQ